MKTDDVHNETSLPTCAMDDYKGCDITAVAVMSIVFGDRDGLTSAVQ
jgi:hypothetical protein